MYMKIKRKIVNYLGSNEERKTKNFKKGKLFTIEKQQNNPRKIIKGIKDKS